MTHIHYKFSSKLSYDTVVFDGPHITLTDLKEQIMGRERLRAGCDLQITNAQTKEEYTDEGGVIPKGSSVIVRRVPGVRSGPVKKTHNIERLDVHSHLAPGAGRAMDDHSATKALPLFSKMVNLAAADVSEDDKIKVVMNQSSYDPMNYNKHFAAPLPSNYTCYRCGNTGHHIRSCPTSGDKSFEAPPKMKKSTGIPRSFMVEVDDPNTKGAMLTSCGRYAVPAIDAEAYALGKKEKYPFLHQEPEKEEERDPVPEELQCLICHDLLVDSVVIPCCGNSYCDDCIRNALLESEGHICPTCNQSDVSPDTLIANKFLRQAVNNYKKEKGYTKSLGRKCAPPQSLPAVPTPSTVPSAPPLGTNQQQKIQHMNPRQQAEVPHPGAHPAFSVPIQPSTETETETGAYSAPDVPSLLPSIKPPTNAPSQAVTLVHTEAKQPSSLGQTSAIVYSSTSSSVCPPGGTAEPQQLPPAPSSNPPAPPPLFPSHHFHSFHSGPPPGHPGAPPSWTHPTPQGAPIPPLVPSSSSSSIPSLIQREWFNHHPHSKERSPRTRSTRRRSSRSRSRSKSSRSSSRSSRSRSRSNGRSRPRSPYSHHRVPHGRSHPPRSYSYGYKRSRSPTPSSSSSPRRGPHSKSHSDQRRNRHHGKRSSHGSHKSSRRSDRSPPSGRPEGDPGQTDYYQQWKIQYKEWYEKYFSSYVSHFHQLPPPLISLPPPPNPLWADRAENQPSHTSDPLNPTQHMHTTLTDRRSPPSQLSTESRSQSSSEGRSPRSASSSDCSSPPSVSPRDPCSLPSGDSEKEATSSHLERELKRIRKSVPGNDTHSPDAAHSTDKRRRMESTATDDKIPQKSKKKDREKETHHRKSDQNGKRRKDSHPGRDEEKRRHVKPRRDAHRTGEDTHPEGSKASKPHRKKERATENENHKEPSHTGTSGSSRRSTEADLEPPRSGKRDKNAGKKSPPSRVTDIWEGGVKVKPQKKISININLDRKKQPEETTGIQEVESGVEKAQEVTEASGEIPNREQQQGTQLHQEDVGLTGEKVTADGGNCREDEAFTGQDFPVADDGDGRHDEENREIMEHDAFIATTEKESTEQNCENPTAEWKPDEEPMEEVTMENMADWKSEEANSSPPMMHCPAREACPEGGVDVTTPPQHHHHPHHEDLGRPELIQVPLLECDEKEDADVLPPSAIADQKEAKLETPREEEVQSDEAIGGLTDSVECCLAPSSGPDGSGSKDTMEHETATNTLGDHDKAENGNNEITEDKKSDTEQEVNPEESKEAPTDVPEAHLSEPMKQLGLVMDVECKTTKEDRGHHLLHHFDHGDPEGTNHNQNEAASTLRFQTSGTSGTPEPSLSRTSTSGQLLNPSEEPKHQGIRSRHSDKPGPRPVSREEQWKRYKLEKMLKEHQQESSNDGDPGGRHGPNDTPRPVSDNSNKPSSSSSSSNVKHSEDDVRPKKHKKEKRHHIEEPEKKHKKSKKRHQDRF
uniref:E3 ubiquitin-protein ligase RBBP6-like n=1 Tax=Doryrhamphus excisus TaxID=161450 RepID=UPI0025AE85CF|nr:E3 ubiquitin-protein ligase RBBP6-like [Doryrhamphus excisus]